MIAEVFEKLMIWFTITIVEFVESGGYLGMAVLLFPLMRKVCYLFKQLTN